MADGMSITKEARQSRSREMFLRRIRKFRRNKLSTAGTPVSYTHLKERVDFLTRQMKNDGYKVVSGPRTTGDGYYESCIVGIEGNQIELTV